MAVTVETAPCGTRVLTLDLEGWHLCAALEAHDRNLVRNGKALLQVVVACPENFFHLQTVALPYADPDAMIRHLEMEAQRVLEQYALPGGTDEGIRFREPGNVPATCIPNVSTKIDRQGIGGSTGDMVVSLELRRRLSDDKPETYRRIGDVVSRLLGNSFRTSRRQEAVLLPSSRQTMLAFLRDHPWMGRTLIFGSGARIVRAIVNAGPRTWGPADIVRLQLLGGSRYDSPWTASAVATVDAFSGTVAFMGSSPQQMVRFLSFLPPEWMPNDVRSYAQANEFSGIDWQGWGTDPEHLAASLFAGMGGRWGELSERTMEAADTPSVEAALSGIEDMIHHVEDDIVLPCMTRLHAAVPEGERNFRQERLQRIAKQLVSPDANIVSLARRSSRWHRVHAVLPVPRKVVSLEWPALTNDFVLGDLGLTFLTSDVDLDEEGAAMEHCVGSYARRCAENGSHIASIRKGGERVSTLEVTTKDGVLVVEQHRSASNGSPPSDAVGLVSRWFGEVMDGNVRMDPAATSVRQGAVLDEFSIPERGMPSDWRGILQRRVCAMSWEELLVEVGRLDGMSPETPELEDDFGEGPFGP